MHDHFHIAKYLNELVDRVCRVEHRKLQGIEDDRLRAVRRRLLFKSNNLIDENSGEIAAFEQRNPAICRAWLIRKIPASFRRRELPYLAGHTSTLGTRRIPQSTFFDQKGRTHP